MHFSETELLACCRIAIDLFARDTIGTDRRIAGKTVVAHDAWVINVNTCAMRASAVRYGHDNQLDFNSYLSIRSRISAAPDSPNIHVMIG